MEQAIVALSLMQRGHGWWSLEYKRCRALCICKEGIKTNLLYLTQNLLLNQTHRP